MRLRILFIGLSQLATGAAVADPYPFEGFFALKTGPAHTGCGFDILHQTRDGAFSGYILDQRHWQAHGTPRFVRYKHGVCTFDAATAIDNCITRVNHISPISDTPNRAKVAILDDTSVSMLTLGEETAEALSGVPPFVFERCPFDAAQIAPLLADTASDYSQEALRDMARGRDAGLQAAVIEAIRTREANVD